MAIQAKGAAVTRSCMFSHLIMLSSSRMSSTVITNRSYPSGLTWRVTRCLLHGRSSFMSCFLTRTRITPTTPRITRLGAVVAKNWYACRQHESRAVEWIIRWCKPAAGTPDRVSAFAIYLNAGTYHYRLCAFEP